ncbi:MAG: hypothetical protein NT051_05570 [Candidatus Micrarchaeota archaeon]|nr:hypothetical protein [Candidatus Micrarchaeota archaeon]
MSHLAAVAGVKNPEQKKLPFQKAKAFFTPKSTRFAQALVFKNKQLLERYDEVTNACVSLNDAKTRLESVDKHFTGKGTGRDEEVLVLCESHDGTAKLARHLLVLTAKEVSESIPESGIKALRSALAYNTAIMVGSAVAAFASGAYLAERIIGALTGSDLKAVADYWAGKTAGIVVAVAVLAYSVFQMSRSSTKRDSYSKAAKLSREAHEIVKNNEKA